MGIGRFAFTPLLPMMREDGLANITDGGVLASVHFPGYWLGAVLAAKVPCGPRTTLRASLLAIGMATVGMGVTDDLTVWLIMRGICGVCSAWVLVLVSNHYVKHLGGNGRGDYQGWVFSGVGAGIALAGLACLAFMAFQTGSSQSWQILGAISLQKRYSNRQLWAASQVVMAVGLLLPVFYPHILTIIAAGFLVGGTFMIITMNGMQETHRLAPPDDVLRHIAAMTASFATGQMIGPVFASFVYALTQSFAVSLVIASAALISTAIVLMRDSRGTRGVTVPK